MTGLTPTQIDDIIAERDAAKAALERARSARERISAAFGDAVMALDGVTPYTNSTGAMLPLDTRIRTVVQRLRAAEEALTAAQAHEPQIERLHQICDRAGAPGGRPITERLSWLLDALDRHGIHGWAAADALLTQIRSALNVGPPSASDVGPAVPAEEVVRIVRARTIAMLDERAQRIALAEQLVAAPRHVVGWLTRAEIDVTDFTHASLTRRSGRGSRSMRRPRRSAVSAPSPRSW